MRKKKQLPSLGELVVCTITTVNPYSVSVELEEYEATGMVHISEVSSRWIKDIREFVKKGQRGVCRVLSVDPQKKHVNLSIKRVSKNEVAQGMRDFKKEEKAERVLEQVAKEMNKSLDDAYNEFGYPLQENFGLMFKGLRTLLKDKNILIKKGMPKNWIDCAAKIAEKTFQQKEIEIECKLKIYSFGPDGVSDIKNALSNATKAGFNVSYISAPFYSVSTTGKNPKELRNKVSEVMEKIVDEMKSKGGAGSFEIIKK